MRKTKLAVSRLGRKELEDCRLRLRELGGSRLEQRELGEFRYRQSEFVGSRLRQQNRMLQVGAEKVCSPKLRHKDLGGSCLGRREIGGSRLIRRELGASKPTVRYKDGRLLQVVRDRA